MCPTPPRSAEEEAAFERVMEDYIARTDLTVPEMGKVALSCDENLWKRIVGVQNRGLVKMGEISEENLEESVGLLVSGKVTSGVMTFDDPCRLNEAKCKVMTLLEGKKVLLVNFGNGSPDVTECSNRLAINISFEGETSVHESKFSHEIKLRYTDHIADTQLAIILFRLVLPIG